VWRKIWQPWFQSSLNLISFVIKHKRCQYDFFRNRLKMPRTLIRLFRVFVHMYLHMYVRDCKNFYILLTNIWCLVYILCPLFHRLPFQNQLMYRVVLYIIGLARLDCPHIDAAEFLSTEKNFWRNLENDEHVHQYVPVWLTSVSPRRFPTEPSKLIVYKGHVYVLNGKKHVCTYVCTSPSESKHNWT
jgi:hypothetical protein